MNLTFLNDIKPFVAILMSIITLAGAVIAILRTAISFNDKSLARRTVEKLQHLEKSAASLPDIQPIISSAMRDEISKKLLGYPCSPNLLSAINKELQTGEHSLRLIRLARPYLDVNKSKDLDVRLGISGWILFVASIAMLLSGIFMFSIGTFGALSLTPQKTWAVIAALMIGSGSTLLAAKEMTSALAAIRLARTMRTRSIPLK